PSQAILDRLGLANLQHLVLYSGFQGRTQRSTAVLHAPGRRQDLLAALAANRGLTAPARPFDAAQLPPLPPDATAVYAHHLDLAALYETVIEVSAGAGEAASPNGQPAAAELFKRIDQALGIDLRKDLLGSLGSLSVVFSAPSEGPMMLGL